jgi:hypothetical protein
MKKATRYPRVAFLCVVKLLHMPVEKSERGECDFDLFSQYRSFCSSGKPRHYFASTPV